jgi:hypothetical protein
MFNSPLSRAISPVLPAHVFAHDEAEVHTSVRSDLIHRQKRPTIYCVPEVLLLACLSVSLGSEFRFQGLGSSIRGLGLQQVLVRAFVCMHMQHTHHTPCLLKHHTLLLSLSSAHTTHTHTPPLSPSCLSLSRSLLLSPSPSFSLSLSFSLSPSLSPLSSHLYLLLSHSLSLTHTHEIVKMGTKPLSKVSYIIYSNIYIYIYIYIYICVSHVNVTSHACLTLNPKP